MTGFSVVPLQAFSLLGVALAIASAVLVIVLALRRISLGAEAEGLFTLFGIALLAAGQSSTFTGTIAGQIIMEGFLDLKIPCWQRRLIRLGLALVPAFIGVWWLGDAGVGKMLVLSEVRRRGLGGRLLSSVEALARAKGRTLLQLDTQTGSAGERLYAGSGWTRFGVVPGHALTPDGPPSATSFFYKQL